MRNEILARARWYRREAQFLAAAARESVEHGDMRNAEFYARRAARMGFLAILDAGRAVYFG